MRDAVLAPQRAPSSGHHGSVSCVGLCMRACGVFKAAARRVVMHGLGRSCRVGFGISRVEASL